MSEDDLAMSVPSMPRLNPTLAYLSAATELVPPDTRATYLLSVSSSVMNDSWCAGVDLAITLIFNRFSFVLFCCFSSFCF